MEAFSRYIEFDRERWKALRANTPLLLSEEDLASLRGINDQVSLSEVSDIYVPLSRLLNLHFAATQHLYEARQQFREMRRSGFHTSLALRAVWRWAKVLLRVCCGLRWRAGRNIAKWI